MPVSPAAPSFPPRLAPCSYVSGGYYARNEGKNWIKTMLVTACLFPLSCFSIAFVLNTIAIFYQVGGSAGQGGRA